MTDTENCGNCDGEGWVCENHPDMPWTSEGCECGAGMPCNVCRPHMTDVEPNRMPERKRGFD